MVLPNKLKRLSQLTFIAVLLVSLVPNICLAKTEAAELPHIEAQVWCLGLAFDAMREGSYTKISTELQAHDADRGVCELMYFDPLIGSGLYHEIRRVSQGYKHEAIDRCETDWRTLIDNAIDVFPTMDWGAALNSKARNVWKTLDEESRGVFELAHFEQIIGGSISKRRQMRREAEQDYCFNNSYIIRILMRAYNIAYYRYHSVGFDILGQRLDDRILFEVWLILLHADLWPEYQAEGIGLFETLKAQGRADGINLDNLRGRLKRASDGFIRNSERTYPVRIIDKFSEPIK